MKNLIRRSTKTILLFLSAMLLMIYACPSAFADCTDPTGGAGDILYNDDEDQMQYCDDTNWIAFPKSSATGGGGSTTYYPNSSGNTAWKAHEHSDYQRPPTTLAFDAETEYNGTELNTISTDDTNGVIGLYVYGGTKIRYTLPEAEADITQLDITISVSDDGMGGPGDMSLYIWDSTNTEWDDTGEGVTSSTKSELTYTITTSITDYVDGSGNLYIAALSDRGNGTHNPIVYYSDLVVTATGGCSNPSGSAGDILYNDDENVLQWCSDSGAWHAAGPNPGTGGSGCDNPSGTKGDLMYNDDYAVAQYCDGDAWIAIGKAVTAPACSTPGETCADGSIYAGSIGGVDLYTTESDNSASSSWNANFASHSTTSTTNGATNQQHIIDTYDINDFPAFKVCNDLTSHSKTDWYLPAIDELEVLYTNQDDIGNFDGDSRYWSSTDVPNSAYWLSFFDGTQGASPATPPGNKADPYPVRCVRRN